MDISTVLKYVGDLGALGVLGLFILVGGYLILQALRLFREQVLPMARNHLEHVEAGYKELATAIRTQSESLEGMRDVQTAQSEALRAHNELTRELIDRLPKNSRVKRLVDGPESESEE